MTNQSLAEDASVSSISSTTPREDSAVSFISTTASGPAVIVKPTREPWIHYPCSCSNGQCGCCSGNILPIRQRACTNVTYNPDDFEFTVKMYFNERLIYTTKMSGKDPRPACVPIRFLSLKFCARLSNVYMVGRNVHACLNLDGYWGLQELYHVNFNCFRIGASGMSFVKPEDGGGLPPPPEEAPLKPGEEDYDDSARFLQEIS
ncbi:uncharacterized protein LOC142321127 [Lycorma delicatula]